MCAGVWLQPSLPVSIRLGKYQIESQTLNYHLKSFKCIQQQQKNEEEEEANTLCTLKHVQRIARM